MNTTNLREAEAVLRAQGVLAEKKLELTTENGVKKITGYLVLKISETDSVNIGVNVASKKSNGKGGYSNDDNKNFAGIETVMNDYKSIADCGLENADYVRVTNGKVRPYFNVKNEKEVMSYSSNFFNRVNRDEIEELYARFEIEAFINSVIPEMYTSGDEAGMPTGRAIVKAWLPTYNGIEPIEFVAPSEDDIADSVMETYRKDMTVLFYGDIVNRKIAKTETVPVKIGKPKVTTTYSYTNELVITGASEPYGEGEAAHLADKAFSPDAVAMAIKERESYIEQKKAQNANGNNNVGSSFQNGAKPASSGRKLPF